MGTKQVSSLQNPAVQDARKLHRRAWRDRAGAFLLEGPVVIADALHAGINLRDVFVIPQSPAAELASRCSEAGARVLEVGDSVLKAIADAASPQDIVAVAEIPAYSLADVPSETDLVLILAQVRDPGNAGTLVRTAAAAGAGCVVFSDGSVDPFGPKAVRASAGAMFKVPIVRSGQLVQIVNALRGKGFRCIAAEAGHDDAIYDLDLSGKTAIVVGNEAWGFQDAPADLLDEVASIPLSDRVESLNVAAAGAVFLFEVARQRRLSSARNG